MRTLSGEKCSLCVNGERDCLNTRNLFSFNFVFTLFQQLKEFRKGPTPKTDRGEYPETKSSLL